MPSIAEIRAQYPDAYSDMSDTALAGALHAKFYSDIPRSEFDQRIGLAPQPTQMTRQQAGDIYDRVGMPQTSWQDTAIDAAKGFGAGVSEAVATGLGGGGDVRNYLSRATEAVGKNFGVSQDRVDQFKNITSQVAQRTPFAGLTFAPTTAEMRQGIESVTGPTYKPETATGEVAKTVGDFAAGAAFPGGPVRRVVGGVLLPALASEGAGRIPGIEGTQYEGAARLAGGLIGGMAGGARVGRSGAAAPTIEELGDQARNAYRTAEQQGVVISQPAFRTAVDDIQSAVKSAGIDQTLHPKATAAMQRLEQATVAPVSLENADVLRRVINGAAKSIEPDERRIAGIAKDKLDDFLESMGPQHVVSGNAPAATAALVDARQNWARMRKGELINDAIDNAKVRSSQFSGSGYENALRTEFRKIAMNDKTMRRFSSEEQQAIKDVAMGGPLANTLRVIGKFAPNQLIGFLGMGAGYHEGDTPGALGMAALGTLGRFGATRMTARSAKTASEMMRRGGPAPVQPSMQTAGRAAVAGFNADQQPRTSTDYRKQLAAALNRRMK
jgi:hypothetical protein